MIPVAYFLLKVTLCSAVLFCYYWFFLRNKIFHAYNRFYLLAIVAISLTLPLCRINIFHKAEAPKTNMIKMLQAVTVGDEFMDEIIVSSEKKHVSFEDITPLLYLAVSAVFLIMLLQMLIHISSLKRHNGSILINDIHFVNTDNGKGTPFSFFKYIFWNSNIDLHSPDGNRIFRHELAHIQERHSWDKMFINMILILFWCNPVFWFIRRELSVIHEFIADKRAVKDGDITAFASMILAAAYPQHRFAITNNFFYSPIKRRIMMLTKQQNARMNYFSRILVLPLIVIVFAAFVIKAKTVSAEKSTPLNPVEKILNKITGSTIEKEQPNPSFSVTDRQITVVIDAGHGGDDAGARNENGVTEKDMTLMLIKKIKDRNTNKNVNIILTREADIFSTPQEKAEFARAQNPDLFISVHLDGSPKPRWNIATGMSVFIANDQIANNESSKILASAVIASFKKNYDLPVGNSPMQRKSGIWILKANSFPSVLIEAGYLTNKTDAAYLQSKKGQETFAMNVLNAINDFASSKDFASLNTTKNTSEIQDSLLFYKGKLIKSYDISFNANENKITNVRVTFPDKTSAIISADEARNSGIDLPFLIPKTPEILNSNNRDTIRRIFTKVENEPEFPGGTAALVSYLEKNLNSSIPEKEGWKSGKHTVAVKFIVEKDGSLTNVTTENYQGTKTAQHCIDILSKGPYWRPAVQNGHMVAAYKTVSVTFLVNPETINKNSDKSESDFLSAKNIDPVFRIGDISGGKIAAAVFKKQKNVTVTGDFEFLNATVYFTGKGFPNVTTANLSGADLSQLNTFIERSLPGTTIVFDNIQVKGKEGIMMIDGKAFILF